MESLYSKPLRVYLLLAACAAWGLLSASELPVSLFPTSSQPVIYTQVSYGSLTADQFYDSIGRFLEPKLQSVRANQIGVQKLTATYMDSSVRYLVRFDWGADAEEAKRLVENEAASVLSGREEAIRRSLGVGSWHQNSGFFALSFYSPLRSLDDLYDLLLPQITPLSSKVPDSSGLGLYNPSSKEITVRLSPELLALHQIPTSQIERAVREAVVALSGGTLKIGDKDFQLTLPKQAVDIENLGNIRISPLAQAPVLLKDVAQLSVTVSKEGLRKFKTSGTDSIILFASPKEGGNIKRMADDIMREIGALQGQWPKDIEFKVLVNPSDFINESIHGVIREVALAAFLAVFVLFLFIGSLRNVATAAIEIPLSLVMAFILMKLTGMNLNLISLGGLALSAGMNVDASVVVLENIFRHFEQVKRQLSFEERVKILIGAVNEVKAPIIASTIASLVVFAPLVFTRGLTNSLLGDLAKAVIFSHGLSAIVALILVPTIRLHLMRYGDLGHLRSPIEKWLNALESLYRRTLRAFLQSRRAQAAMVLSVILILPALAVFVLPRLQKEVIGKPETDWVMVGIYSPTFNTIKQMEAEIEKLEAELGTKFGAETRYTFTQINGSTNGHVMMRLKSRKKAEDIANEAENIFKNTATLFYWVERWNPSELEIPDPPDFELEILGGNRERRQLIAEDVVGRMSDQGLFDKRRVEPTVRREQAIMISPLETFSGRSEVITRSEFSHYLRTALTGLYVDDLSQGAKSLPIYLRFPENMFNKLEQIKALPYGFEGRLIPLGALANFSMQPKPPEEKRENQSPLVRLTGTMNKTNKALAKQHEEKALLVVEEYRERLRQQKDIPLADQPSLNLAVPDWELRDALDQLKWAVLISTALVFLVMVIQLGDLIQASLVMLAIPLGLIGVVSSLYLFGSTLSLNSGLGTILLNGIAVANSIILVDFIQKLFQNGKSALNATVEASTARLRPILMTSLTTVLGMLPIALGMGEGGKILQPLGVAVCGGLWVSTLMTLYIVPALQYRWLSVKEKRRPRPFLQPTTSLHFEKEPEAHP